MEQIPPGYCYLCFPPVTHKQAYTFARAQPHEHTLGCARVLAPSAADVLDR